LSTDDNRESRHCRFSTKMNEIFPASKSRDAPMSRFTRPSGQHMVIKPLFSSYDAFPSGSSECVALLSGQSGGGCPQQATQRATSQESYIMVSYGCLGGTLVRASAVTGSTPGQGAIKSPRLTQPSIPPGVGKSSTSPTGWG